MAEMMGRKTGAHGGKGGSMHFYSAKNKFYGGNGIVGAQIPVGTGVAFAMKYKGEKNFCVAMFGDGAANQGQQFEAANMAGLWKLPMVYFIENNRYGMGTSQNRSSHNNKYYTKGANIPGFAFDAQNVLMVREAIKWAGAYVKEHGPLFLEADTYRYHGHSMSDPGITYRTKEEIMMIREGRDPVEKAKQMLLEFGWATEEELKEKEKAIRKQLDDEYEQIKNDPFPEEADLYTHVGVTPQHFIRHVHYNDSKHIDPKFLQ